MSVLTSEHGAEPPTGRCCHWQYQDTWPKFDAIQTTDREGRRYSIPVLMDEPYDPDAPLAVAVFFTPATCPVCEGSETCPECGRKVRP